MARSSPDPGRLRSVLAGSVRFDSPEPGPRPLSDRLVAAGPFDCPVTAAATPPRWPAIAPATPEGVLFRVEPIESGRLGVLRSGPRPGAFELSRSLPTISAPLLRSDLPRSEAVGGLGVVTEGRARSGDRENPGKRDVFGELRMVGAEPVTPCGILGALLRTVGVILRGCGMVLRRLGTVVLKLGALLCRLGALRKLGPGLRRLGPLLRRLGPALRILGALRMLGALLRMLGALLRMLGPLRPPPRKLDGPPPPPPRRLPIPPPPRPLPRSLFWAFSGSTADAASHPTVSSTNPIRFVAVISSPQYRVGPEGPFVCSVFGSCDVFNQA